MGTMCFSVVKMKLGFSGNPMSRPEHFGRFQVTNFKDEITLFSTSEQGLGASISEGAEVTYSERDGNRGGRCL